MSDFFDALFDDGGLSLEIDAHDTAAVDQAGADDSQATLEHSAMVSEGHRPGGWLPDAIEASYDLVEPIPDEPARVDSWEPGSLSDLVGDVGETVDNWHDQGPTNACAIVAQGSIIEAITGQPFDQPAATDWLESNGFYTAEGGTSMSDTTRLFDAFEIEHEAGPRSVVEIYDALRDGKHVMVGLDANEIWYPKQDPVSGSPLEWHRPGGHAVWVTGIGLDDASNEWKVVLNDSGHPNGRGSVVSLADFMNATDDYGNYSVIASTQKASPSPEAA